MTQVLIEKFAVKQKYERSLALTFVFFILVFIDQLTKSLAENVFYNSVFAFSLPLPAWLIYAIYALVLGIMLVYCKQNHREFSKFQIMAWVLILAGAVSNIFERIILGHVRDWIYVLSGIFNFADLYIIAGVLILLANPKSFQ